MRRLSYLRLGALFSLLGFSVGCDLVDGLADLGDDLVLPDKSILDAPGRKVADGTYRSLTIDGTKLKGGFVLAFRTDTKKEKLAVVPFLEGNGCEVSDALAFERVSSRVDIELPGMIAVEVEEDGKSNLHLVDFDCNDVTEPIANSSVPKYPFPIDEPKGMLVLTRDSVVYFLDPKAVSHSKVASGILSGQGSTERLFLYDGKQVQVFDTDLKKRVSLGTNVKEYRSTGGSSPELLYVDDEGLWRWSAETGPVLLAADGCSPWVSGVDPGTIAFLSPCDTRRLQIEVSGASVSSAAKRILLLGPEKVDLSQGLLETYYSDGSASFAFVRTESSESTTGTLVVAGSSPPGDATTIALEGAKIVGENFHLNAGVPYSGPKGELGDLYSYIAPTSSTGKGDLVFVAPKVSQIFGANFRGAQGVLANFDGDVGELWSFVDTDSNSDPKSKVLGKKVPPQYVISTNIATEAAFVGNLSGETGKLHLVRNNEALVIAEKAFPNSLRFLSQPKAIVYFRPTENAGTRLSAYLLESELTADISNHVNEYRGVPWPSPGILYATKGGDDDGLWFAKAR